MSRAFVGIGSNVEPELNLRESIRLLAERAKLVGISTIYRTEALKHPEQPRFLNCVVEIDTELGAEELERRVLKEVERERGRRRDADPYAPRTCDLDLVVYDPRGRAGETARADPEILLRPFLSLPLLELAPDLSLPGHTRPLREEVGDASGPSLERLEELTESLRKRFLHGHQH